MSFSTEVCQNVSFSCWNIKKRDITVILKRAAAFQWVQYGFSEFDKPRKARIGINIKIWPWSRFSSCVVTHWSSSEEVESSNNCNWYFCSPMSLRENWGLWVSHFEIWNLQKSQKWYWIGEREDWSLAGIAGFYKFEVKCDTKELATQNSLRPTISHNLF